MSPASPPIEAVCCVSDWHTFAQHLGRSPCLQRGGWPLTTVWNASSAAAAFNRVLDTAEAGSWVLWAHQDAHLPLGFDRQLGESMREAERRWPDVDVIGVYGTLPTGGTLPAPAPRAGRLLDRGEPLIEPVDLPCEAAGLDEVVLLVRGASRLRMDPSLGFDFYGTDLALQARRAGRRAVIVDAWCEHWSDLPRGGAMSALKRARLKSSAAAFEAKWHDALPITTPCFQIDRVGDVARFIDLHSHDA